MSTGNGKEVNQPILAIGGSDHDVNACVLADGRISVCIEEERLSRKKYGIGGNLLDGLAHRYCTDFARLDSAQVNNVVADSILPPTAILSYRKRARRIDHHLLHASCAWFTSGFESAAILVVDNAGGMYKDNGEWALQATSWYHAKGRDIELVGRVGSTNWKEGRVVNGQPYQRGDGDHSLGHLYKKATGALGYRYPRNSNANGYFFPEDGITMGLASYGDGRFVDAIWDVVELLPEGRYRIALNDGRLDKLLAGWLEGNAPFEVRAAVAAGVQEVLTRVMCHLFNHVMEVTNEKRVCIAGGVAMNSVTNGDLMRRTSVESLYVPPIPGDNGTSIGAALWTATRNADSLVPRYSVYGGRPYSRIEIDAALSQMSNNRFAVLSFEEGDLIKEVAQRIADGKVIAWFEGGSENGRRALGHRSLLADPRRTEMRDHINGSVKHREAFRPFAPVVPADRAGEFFELRQESPYMQIVFPVRREWREKLAAITHVDGSARVQTLREDQHERLYKLLLSFEKITGIPVLLNTSFNPRGMPIVETPADALACLDIMPIDGLIIEDRLVIKR